MGTCHQITCMYAFPYFTSGVYVSQKSLQPEPKPEDKPAVQSEKSAVPAAPTSAAVPAEADDEPVPSAEPGINCYTNLRY